MQKQIKPNNITVSPYKITMKNKATIFQIFICLVTFLSFSFSFPHSNIEKLLGRSINAWHQDKIM